jgi:hypothetical protein
MTAKEFRELNAAKKANSDYYIHGKEPEKEIQIFSRVEFAEKGIKYSEQFVLDFANWWADKNNQCGVSDLRKFEKLNSSKMQ